MTATNGVLADVAVVIVNYRTPGHVLDCLGALAEERRRSPSFDVVVVDGGSGDASVETIAAGVAGLGAGDWVSLLPLSINGGFGYANNEAIRRLMARATPPRFIHLLNPDAVIEPGAIAALRAALEHEPNAACAGSLLVGEGGEAQGSAFDFPSMRSEFVRGLGIDRVRRLLGSRSFIASAQTTRVGWVTGASVMLRMAALREAGLFDEGFFLYFEEVELMHRLTDAGWQVLHVPDSRVHHIGGVSTGVADGGSAPRRLPGYWYRSRRRYFALTGGRLHAWMASAAWLTGALVWRPLFALGIRPRGAHAPHEEIDLIRQGLYASRRDSAPVISPWDSPTGHEPAWMKEF
ncbi:hypothetical protein GGQ80_000913 [Sphingomonas jinjuensis]|uniref:Glycosyltransferase family 2 protein n=1 Tax=Sphingomonas jinjuensis TaxID=535907 RepID=A0A840FI47_9SPHN|nr:glycosyltransferase family 2 protein [Sphingomonas jinjuensis]MBB4153025.1 hypothetical protein [Sphingomonas jinjuensis]